MSDPDSNVHPRAGASDQVGSGASAVAPAADAEPSDAALMQRVSAGNAAAYRVLAERHTRRILNYSHRILGNAAEAEDVTQETFLKLWTMAPSWTPAAQLTTWLFRVAHNLSIDRVRRRRPETDLEQVELGSDSLRPSHMLERRQTAELVQRAIAELPERQRHALQLAHYEGLGNPEIGEIIGVTVEAVESLLARARRALRTSLSAGLQGEERVDARGSSSPDGGDSKPKGGQET